MRRVLISTKPFIFVLFPVGVTVRSAESLSSAIPLGTSTERANSKRANLRLFQDAVSSVSFWLRSFSVCGWRTRSLSSVSGPPTRWSYVRGWLMCLLWAYEHDFAAISPFLYERIGTLCRHPCWSLWLEQRIAGWRSGRSEGYCKSLSAGNAPTDLLLLTQRTSISFGAPSVDRMTIAASGDGFTSSEDEGAVGLPPSGVVATAAPDPELMAMLAQQTARGQQTAQSRALAAGRLVSRSGARLTTAPCPGAFLPGGAWGADEFVDGPFHGQKPLVRLLRPHYPRWRSGQGVRGHSPGGESGRGALVPTKQGGKSSLSVAVSRKSIAHIAPGASEAPNSSLSATEGSRKGRLSPNRGWPTG